MEFYFTGLLFNFLLFLIIMGFVFYKQFQSLKDKDNIEWKDVYNTFFKEICEEEYIQTGLLVLIFLSWFAWIGTFVILILILLYNGIVYGIKSFCWFILKIFGCKVKPYKEFIKDLLKN
jgi:hypothetical protein